MPLIQEPRAPPRHDVESDCLAVAKANENIRFAGKADRRGARVEPQRRRVLKGKFDACARDDRKQPIDARKDRKRPIPRDARQAHPPVERLVTRPGRMRGNLARKSAAVFPGDFAPVARAQQRQSGRQPRIPGRSSPFSRAQAIASS